MEDTTPKARSIVREIVLSKSVEERLLLCAQMYEDAKELAKIGMPDGLTRIEQDRYIFRRIHGNFPEDFVRSFE